MEKFTPGDVVNLVRSNGSQLLVTVNKKKSVGKKRDTCIWSQVFFLPNSILFESGVRLHVVKDY